MENNNAGFFRNHIDTLAIITVNVAIAAILVTLYISNSSNISCMNARIDSRLDAASARMDTLHTMFYDLLKETKK